MKMFPFLRENMETLDQQGQMIVAWLAAKKPNEQRIKDGLFVNRHGLIDWRLPSGLGMFEQVPPQAFYSDWNGGSKPDTSATILVGCNVGYGLNRLLTNTPDSHKIVVVEPNPELLLSCLGQTDFRPFLEHRKLHFALPEDDYLGEVIKNLDLQYIYGVINLRADLPSQQMGPEYASLLARIKGRVENFCVEMNTLRSRQDVMVGNELKNFHRALSDGSLAGLEGSARGVTAVILGAGPSLLRFAPEFVRDPGYALYATALQTMPTLQAQGVTPHFCLAIDYDPGMLKIFDRLDLERAATVPLIYSTKVQPELVRRYPGPTIPLWTIGGVATFAMKDRELVLDAGGNVSLTLTRFLHWCGVSRLLLAGQDFAWSGEQTHADGHHAAGRKVVFNPRAHLRIKNLHGEEIITSPQYMAAKRELEMDLRKTNLPVFGLYGGGAPIEGVEMLDMAQVRERGLLTSIPGSVESFRGKLLASRERRHSFDFEPRSPRWSSSMRHAEKQLTKLFRNLGGNQKEIHGLFEQALLFIKQDPLYVPYLFNEIINLSGLAKARHSYEPKDLAEFRRIEKDVLRKVREVDRCLLPAGSRAA
ncbi:6-hydroxymethylpterin diphosphokinase MptE-like protein [Desulfovibrio aminophilus]|uniref:motility associated factor glycosyltransferase family protein n=1 Tax=Desulfovibrio aminophilus TaxID=81425 RepID=UPI003391823B